MAIASEEPLPYDGKMLVLQHDYETALTIWDLSRPGSQHRRLLTHGSNAGAVGFGPSEAVLASPADADGPAQAHATSTQRNGRRSSRPVGRGLVPCRAPPGPPDCGGG